VCVSLRACVQLSAAAALPAPPRHADAKLFLGLFSYSVSDDDLRRLMERYGEVTECYILKAKGGANKGCAFVKYADRDCGNLAIAALHEKVSLPGAKVNSRMYMQLLRSCTQTHRHTDAQTHSLPLPPPLSPLFPSSLFLSLPLSRAR